MVFLVDFKCWNTIIFTRLSYTSSQKVFHEIMTNFAVKWSIMALLLVRKMDE